MNCIPTSVSMVLDICVNPFGFDFPISCVFILLDWIEKQSPHLDRILLSLDKLPPSGVPPNQTRDQDKNVAGSLVNSGFEASNCTDSIELTPFIIPTSISLLAKMKSIELTLIMDVLESGAPTITTKLSGIKASIHSDTLFEKDMKIKTQFDLQAKYFNQKVPPPPSSLFWRMNLLRACTIIIVLKIFILKKKIMQKVLMFCFFFFFLFIVF